MISRPLICDKCKKKITIIDLQVICCYTLNSLVLSIARQGIHINRTEKQQNRFIARQGIHLFSIDMLPLREKENRRHAFFY
jgi:hypothetical protein